MKRSNSLTFLAVVLLALLAPRASQAQSSARPDAGGPKQDQVIQELLSEVRQLRIALQRVSVNAYRGRIMAERLRLQQEQVNRLTQELDSTRNQLQQLKAEQLGAKVRLDEAEKQHYKGLLTNEDLTRARIMAQSLEGQEQILNERAIRLAPQLETERGNLADLNRRLDALEAEMMTTSQSDDAKGKVKR